MAAIYLKKRERKALTFRQDVSWSANQWRLLMLMGLRASEAATDCLRFRTVEKKSFLCWMWHAWLLLSGEMRVLQHRDCVASSLLMTVECWVYVDFMCYPKPLQIPPHWPKNNRNIYETSLARTMATSPNKLLIRHIWIPTLAEHKHMFGDVRFSVHTCSCASYRVHTVCWKSTLFW